MGHLDDLMCVGRSGLDTFLAKLKCVYELTSTILGPDAGEEQEGTLLGRSICWRTNGVTWTGNHKLVKEALDEWEMCEATEVETLGMTEEYDVQTLSQWRLHEQGVCRWVPKNRSQIELLGDCVRIKRSFQVHELTKTRRRSEIEENIEISVKETYNDTSLRVAGSSRRIDRVHRQ